MNTDAFIQQIIDNPLDDMLRMMFADHLEEQGDPRSEMIRIQFQRAALKRSDPQRAKLRRRELKLLKEHGGFGRVPSVAKPLAQHGGFLDEVEITITRFLKHQEELFKHAPVRAIRFIGNSKRFAKLSESPYLSQLQSITFHGNKLTSEEVRKFVAHPALENLETLHITIADIRDDVAIQVAASEALTGLTDLSLFGGIGPRAVEALTQSQSLTGLRRLTLGHGLADASLALLGDAENLKGLKFLSALGAFYSEGCQALQQGTSLKELEDLRLRGYRPNWGESNRQMAKAFDVSTPLPALDSVNVAYSSIGDGVLVHLATNYHHLKTVDASGNGLTDKSVRVLARSPLLASLDKLVLTANSVTVKGVKALTSSEFWTGKTKLHLRSNRISTRESNKLKEQHGKTFGNFGKPSRWR